MADSRKGKPWNREEIEAAVRAYVRMLVSELRGEVYVKSDVVRELAPLLPDRTRPSIERKFQNVSAVLDEEGLDWIDGYKPLPHYQSDLRSAVLEHIGSGHRIAQSLAAYEDAALPPASGLRLATDDVLVPTPSSGTASRSRSSVALTGSQLAAMRDFKKRQLGEAGEAWVLALERERLMRHGRADLSEQVRWVAQVDGDAAGYDIRSYRPDGAERLIEVKTTNLGIRTPFYITRWEVDFSARRPTDYSLYRVHGFNRDPRIYVLDGSIRDVARLEPKVFLGLPL